MSVFPIQPSFAGGELSPNLQGRVDLNKYAVGLRRLENFVVHPHGGLTRRPGMEFIARAKGKCRLATFQYNLMQAYVLEFGDKYIRFFRDGKPVMNGSAVYEVATPYAASEIDSLSFTQSADVLFICHGAHQPMELTRYSETNWKLRKFDFKNGPFKTKLAGQGQIRLKPSGTNGNITIEADAPIFNEKHVGSLWSFTHNVPEYGITIAKDVADNEATVSGQMMWQEYSSGTVVVHRRSEGDDYYVEVTVHNCNGYLLCPASSVENVTVGMPVTQINDVLSTLFPKLNAKDGTVTSISDAGSGNKKIFVSMWQNQSFEHIPSGYAATLKFRIPNTGADAWTKELWVTKRWRFYSGGFWGGTVYIQRWDNDERDWKNVRIISNPIYPDGTATAAGTRVYEDSGEVDEPVKMRIYSTNFKRFRPQDNAEQDRGYLRFTRGESTNTGIVKCTGYTDSQHISARVIKTLYSAGSSPDSTLNWQEGSWSDLNGWPETCGFYQERIVFGATRREPQTIWMSKTGDYNDFGTSTPVVDDDAVNITLAARQVNAIRSFISLQDLLILTSGSEWRLRAGNKSDAVTPTSISVSTQGYRGISQVPPIVIGNTILFVQARGQHVRDFAYTFESDGYSGNDLTVLASHIFENHTIVDFAYQQEPDSICWVVRDDGELEAMTYLREHEVVAWSRMPTDGKVESVAAQPSVDGDIVYLSVLRNGIRCIETMTPAHCVDPADAFFLDSAVRKQSSTAFTEISGLSHLNGKKVSILADGSLRAQATVANGKVTISPSAKKVVVGLPYKSALETMDINFSRPDGAQLTRTMRVVAVRIRVADTRGVFAGTDVEHMQEQFDRAGEAYGTPTKLFTGDYKLILDSHYDSGRIVIECPHPLPASIVTLVPEVVPGG